jgi:UDP-N-acetylmuramyl pentapeptide synthase
MRLAEAAKTGGMLPGTVAHVATSADAADLAQRKVRPGDLVLVKGSHGIRTDVVVDRLKVEFA